MQIILSYTLLHVATAQSPQLVLELSANNVTAGEQLNASCSATTSAQSRVLYINDEPVSGRISLGDRLTVISVPADATTTWIINPVQREDAGEYYCFAGGNQGSHDDSPRQNVTVYCEFKFAAVHGVCTYMYTISIIRFHYLHDDIATFSAVLPILTIAMPAENVLSGQSTAVVISVDALPEITDVQVFLPSANARTPSLSAEGVTYGNVTLNFFSVNCYNNGAHTVNFTNAVGSGTINIQLTVYC